MGCDSTLSQGCTTMILKFNYARDLVLSRKKNPANNRAATALRMGASTLYAAKTTVGAFFRRMRSRLGAPKAVTAATHKIVRILYRMLTTGENYREAGEN